MQRDNLLGGRGNMMDWNKIKSEDLNKFLKKI